MTNKLRVLRKNPNGGGHFCHNPNLGLMTKARACKVVGQKGSPGVKESVRE